jgi:altronate hydrolase
VSELVRLDPDDTVAVAVADLEPGRGARWSGDGPAVTVREAVPRGHKLALADHAAGTLVLKYGHPIGRATAPIPAGAWVHGHNLASALTPEGRYQPGPPFRWSGREEALRVLDQSGLPGHFLGYRRPDGRAAVRREVWVIPTVGCVNSSAQALAERGRREFGLDAWAFTHPYGCSQLGGDLEATRTVLARLATHPNAAGAVVVALGCENNTLPELQAAMGADAGPWVHVLKLQDLPDEEAASGAVLAELAGRLAGQARQALPLAELVVGLKCGGSDGFSGVTANPLLGRVCELLVAAGASAVMGEVPEMFGAEALLMARSADPGVFAAQVAMIEGFKAYYTRHGQAVYENPSPGNRDGGITTLEEKALGCIRKAGRVPVADVLPYGGRVRRPGLSLVATPGNDLVSCTALTAAGAHLILFTTGRGTPFGAPAPTFKVASHSRLAAAKPGWIDFDAGPLLAGAGLDPLAVALLRDLLAAAEGRPTRAERGGQRDMALFKEGVIL